jgi:hypothetical protein
VRDGWVKHLVVDDQGRLEKFSNQGAIKEIVGDSVHDSANEGALEETTFVIKVTTKSRLESLNLHKAIDLKVDPSGAIRPLADLPIGLQAVNGREYASYLLQQIRTGFLSDSWINRDKDVIHGVAFLPGNNAKRDQRV